MLAPGPGLSFELQGERAAANSRDDIDYAPPTWDSLNANFFSLSSPSAGPSTSPRSPTSWQSPASVAQSRKSSASSTCSTESSCGSVATASTSLAGSFAEESPMKRAAKAAALGEDPALAAARRALWDDDPLDQQQQDQPQIDHKLEPEAEAQDSDEDEPFDPRESVALRNARLFALPLEPAPHSPCHARRPPLSSCLRSSSSTWSTADSSPSLGSSCSQGGFSSPRSPSSTASSFSVQFSDQAPCTFLTYSKDDYERRGDPTVEKLTVREFIELREVKTAVGLWSGNVAKWVDVEALALETQLAQLADAQAQVDEEDAAVESVALASVPVSPSQLTLCEKRGSKAHLVLENVKNMDDQTQLTVKPHFSPTVAPATSTEP